MIQYLFNHPAVVIALVVGFCGTLFALCLGAAAALGDDHPRARERFQPWTAHQPFDHEVEGITWQPWDDDGDAA